MEPEDLNRMPEHDSPPPSMKAEREASNETGLPNEREISVHVRGRRSRISFIHDTPKPPGAVTTCRSVLQYLQDIFVGGLTGAVIAVIVDYLLLGLLRILPGNDWLLSLPIPGYFLLARYLAIQRRTLGHALGIVSILLTLLLTTLAYLATFMGGPPD